MLSAAGPLFQGHNIAPAGGPADWTPIILLGLFAVGAVLGYLLGQSVTVGGCTCIGCGCRLMRDCRESHHVCCRCGRRRPKETNKTPTPLAPDGDVPDFVPAEWTQAIGKELVGGKT